MQSQGSTSSQPSFDSLSSSDSLLFSDLDDTDVFLTDASSSSALLDTAESTPAAANASRASDSPGSQWACDGFKDEEEDAYSGDMAPPEVPKSEGDLLFAQKCAELQGFVRPLMELLNGLKKGRFDRGLSSFQQSVAMDRIQRIIGVLRKPNCGEKYLNTLLQVEMMLKVWFPHISTQPVSAASSVANSPARSLQDATGTTPPHKHRDQLHIPVKKRRLSWTGTESPTPSPGLPKCPRLNAQEKKKQDESGEEEEDKEGGRSPPPSSSSSHQISPTAGPKGNDSDCDDSGKPTDYRTGRGSEPSLTWVHVAPIPSPRKTGSPTSSGDENGPGPATQDSAVSSTTPPKHSKNQKKSARCQSQPVTEQGDDTRQGPSRVVKPLNRVGPAPAET
ncbi:uncharacterized protein LOC130914861 [Corythoichthys intestinalis]|uniref:uncharacterized protein LOC130914861 n=1 Tax=Corythoichthys intestinalis TaxID=161448 RepID=UPI0025A55D7B|nr:uncharacterized protein LOC130914861 [Corythoichthys intestinalis]XP_061789535.1 uncharacterized protein LOC133579019 [Nerophis lumbriciformis]